MNRKRTRLSLSRRKKMKTSGVEDTKSELCVPDKNSEIEFFPPDETPVIESKQNDTDAKDSQCNKKVKFSSKTKETAGVNYMDHNHGKPVNKRIVTWFMKPCSPKSVSCPMCRKLVILSKINQHLDSNCKLHLALLVTEDLTTDELAEAPDSSPCSSDFTKTTAPEPSYQTADRRENMSECFKPSVKSPQLNDENLALEGVSSILKSANERTDVTLMKKMSRKLDGEKPGVVNVDEESCIVIESNESNCNVDQVDAYQEPCGTLATPSREEKGIQNNDNIGLKEMSTQDPNEVLEPNKNLVEDGSENSKDKEDKDHEPYYLANFKLVLNSVLSNEDDRQLFNEADYGIIDAFNDMSSEEQKLYIRLFQRKHGWFRCSKLEYPRISSNLTPILKSLAKKGFVEDESHLTDLQEALNLTAAPDLKLLVKTLHISSKSVSQKGGTKEDTIEMIVNHAENQKTLCGSFKDVVLKRAKQALGCCVRLAANPKDVFSRLLLLFTMNVIPDDEDTSNNGQAQQLSMLYLANIGKVVYPAYVTERSTPVFHSRESLIQFSEACQQKYEMLVGLENKNFEQAYSYYPEASKKFDDILAKLKDCSEIPAALLPEHLRCFTAEWAITKMCYYGVEVLQKWRQYDEAVNQLESLLQQSIFCLDSRGRWYERLALNLHQHLKKPEKAMQVIREALSDQYVRFGRRLALVQRAKRILSSPAFTKGKKKKCEDYFDLKLDEPNPSKSITISGTRCAELGVFIAPEIDQGGQVIDGTTTFCAVEEYALSYYRQKGFDQGIHGEGSTFSSLYTLFMWDIIFASGIPDVFRSPFQAAPLDFCHDAFYESRKEIIDKRLEEISIVSIEELQDILAKAWNDKEGQVCVGISWDRFTSMEQAQQLVACLGGQIMSGIFTRFAQGYRYSRAGMPDLVVWNSSTLDYMIAEVKGPGDKLSTKQQIWLDVLQSLGANVEVCYVTDVGAKRLKVSI